MLYIYIYIYICETNAVHLCRACLFTMLGYGKSRHFRDDPVCPDPVWKLFLFN